MSRVEYECVQPFSSLRGSAMAHQAERMGILYGRYELDRGTATMDGVPLGLKCVISAVHEPPQEALRPMEQVRLVVVVVVVVVVAAVVVVSLLMLLLLLLLLLLTRRRCARRSRAPPTPRRWRCW